MKIRKGFVSNSSSSSFVCDISGCAEGGWDACLSDVGMIECINGHVFIYDGYPEVEAWSQDNGHDTLPEELCPICNGAAKAEIIERLHNEMTRLNISIDDLAKRKHIEMARLNITKDDL